jgi:tetratricopeptide (TPR) repeat protein
VEPLLFAGLAYINLGNLAAVDSILTLARPHLQTLHEAERLGFEYLDATVRGDRQEAYRVHQRYPELAPGGLAHWALANTALAVNRPRQTVRVSRQLDPGRGELRGWYLYWRDLGRAHHMLGEHRDELDVARRATELFPDEPQTSVAETRALAAMGRVDDVNHLLRRHVHGGATTLRLRQQAALEFFAHDYPDAAEAVLREGVDSTTGPGTVGAPLIVAQHHSLLGQYDRAEAILRELAAAYPTSITVRGALGVLLARRGLVDEATSSATWLADLDRPYMHGSNTYWRARIAAQLGSLDLAVQLIQQAFRDGVGTWDNVHRDPDFAPLRDYGPFNTLLRARG